MKAAVLEQPGRIANKTVSAPRPRSNEVVISISLRGICGSDYSMFKGKYNTPFPIIPGHEAIGVIEETGAEAFRFKIGQRVIIHPNYSCGECNMCRKGLKNICRQKVRLGMDIDGVFAESVAVPEKALYPVPETLADKIAVFAEPLAVSAHGVNLANISGQDKVLIFGAGVIGQLTLQLALQHSKHVSACDLIPSRLELAQQFGANEGISDQERLAALHDSFDVIFETSGANSALEQAIKLAAPKGTIVLLGVPSQPNPIATDLIVRKELQIKGSMIYTDEIPECIELLNQGKINTEPLLSKLIKLEDLQSALENFSAPDRLKTLIEN